mmetsp:Transcript_20508/g.38249  ORF Transcript_20508/g.38249 Transcript_20508/m.38249 type:complete len:206 (+) Transcript_20508:892-1509(+)
MVISVVYCFDDARRPNGGLEGGAGGEGQRFPIHRLLRGGSANEGRRGGLICAVGTGRRVALGEPLPHGSYLSAARAQLDGTRVRVHVGLRAGGVGRRQFLRAQGYVWRLEGFRDALLELYEARLPLSDVVLALGVEPLRLGGLLEQHHGAAEPLVVRGLRRLDNLGGGEDGSRGVLCKRLVDEQGKEGVSVGVDCYWNSRFRRFL